MDIPSSASQLPRALPVSWTSANPFQSPEVVFFGWQEVRVFYVFVDKMKSKWWLTDILSCLHVCSYLVTWSNLDLRNMFSIGLTTMIQLASRFLPKLCKSVPKRATFLDPKPAPRNWGFLNFTGSFGVRYLFSRFFCQSPRVWPLKWS